MNRSLIIKGIDKYIQCEEEGNTVKAKTWIEFCCRADLWYNKVSNTVERGTEEVLLEKASEYEQKGNKQLANKLMITAEELDKIYNKLK